MIIVLPRVILTQELATLKTIWVQIWRATKQELGLDNKNPSSNVIQNLIASVLEKQSGIFDDQSYKLSNQDGKIVEEKMKTYKMRTQPLMI